MGFLTVILYIAAGLFGYMGLAILGTAFRHKFKHIGLNLGAACYLLGSIGAFSLNQWWPLIVAFIFAWIFRLLGGDPGYR